MTTFLTRKEVGTRLGEINTGFSYNGEELHDWDFSSFVACTHPLEINSKVREYIDTNYESEKERKEAATPSQLAKLFYGNSVDFSFPKDFFSNEKFNNNYMFVGINIAARGEADGERTDRGKWGNFRDTKIITNTYKLYEELGENDMFEGSYITDIIKNVVDSNAGKIVDSFFIHEKKRKPNLPFTSANGNDDERAEELQRIFESNENKAEKDAVKKGITYLRKHLSREQALKNVQINKENYFKSADLFSKAINVVRPNKLVVFGDAAALTLQQMLKTDAFRQDANVTKLVQDLVEIPHYGLQGSKSGMYHWLEVEAPNAFAKIEHAGFTTGLNW